MQTKIIRAAFLYMLDLFKLWAGRIRHAQFCDRHGHIMRVIRKEWYAKPELADCVRCVAYSCSQTIIVCDRCETITKEYPYSLTPLHALTLNSDRMQVLDARGIIQKGERDSDWDLYFEDRV